MRRSLLALACLPVLAAPALFAPGSAQAADQDFSIVNRTGYQIDSVYVSPVNVRNWGEDVMGKDALADGETVNITFPNRTNTCNWDLKVKFNDGDESTWSNMNLCRISKVSLFWDRNSNQTRAQSE